MSVVDLSGKYLRAETERGIHDLEDEVLALSNLLSETSKALKVQQLDNLQIEAKSA
jgi:hypothetical protein